MTGLISAENFKSLQGVSLKDVEARLFYQNKKVAPNYELSGDLLFTHEGISGPLAYKISSICARFEYSKEVPLLLRLNLLKEELNLQDLLNSNSKKGH